MLRNFIASIALLLITALPALASDKAGAPGGNWPQWRGPNRDDISTETGLLKKWGPDQPKLLWKAQGLGSGFSSVSIADGKIFTMGDTEDGSYLIALSEADGQPLWRTRVGESGEYGGYPGPRCTPSFDEGSVYTLSQHGDLVCVDAATGETKWSHQLAEELNGAKPGWGYSESPLVEGDLVIVTPGGPEGTLIAFNKKSGEPAWRSTDWKDNAHYSSAIAVDHRGKRQVIQLTDASVAGVDVTDGSLLWRADRKGATAVIPTPLFKDGLVFVTSSYGIGCNLFEVTADGGKFDAKQVYANTEMVNHHGGVILIGDHVYGHSDNGGLMCMELKTGEVKWRDRSVGKGAVTFADGHLYLRSEETGNVALVEANPQAYKEHGELEQPDRSNAAAWPHPVIAAGRLYLRDQDILLCYDVKGE